jgi:hypothetical protein
MADYPQETTAQLSNLETFYRSLRTRRLQEYRSALMQDLADARAGSHRLTSPARTIETCELRIPILERVLQGRGAPLELSPEEE